MTERAYKNRGGQGMPKVSPTERRQIERLLAAGWRPPRIAARLGISRSTMYRIVFWIDRDHQVDPAGDSAVQRYREEKARWLAKQHERRGAA